MKKITIVLSMAVVLSCSVSLAQTNCNTAINRLQYYAAQVNQIYQNEYWRVIPGQRCPAFDRNGIPYNPQVVQNCRLQMLGYLNNWYAQQCNYVNNLYSQIVQGCQIPDPGDTPAPDPEPGTGQSAKISTSKIKQLSAGVDEDKTVKITIPTTADGFKPDQ